MEDIPKKDEENTIQPYNQFQSEHIPSNQKIDIEDAEI